MRRSGSGPRRMLLAGAVVLATWPATGAFAASQRAAAFYIEQVLYNFCSQSHCTDGQYPQGGLIMDPAGNLYGTTLGGGSQYNGTVFKLTPNGSGWTQTVLYSFCCSQGNCSDGAQPLAGLVMDGAGKLYGTTNLGGIYNPGTVFQLAPNGSGWTETVLYTFCSVSSCADGESPGAGLLMDAAGNLYGTTIIGGSHAAGAVFKLAPNGPGWTETVLYNFCAQSNCTDGESPFAGLIMDAASNLYGTTQVGGSGDGGTVFELTPSGSGWAETVLYSFCSRAIALTAAFPRPA